MINLMLADYEKTATFACEGLEQRIMPTRVASRDNEVDGAPEFQRKALSESGYFRKSLMGMDTAK